MTIRTPAVRYAFALLTLTGVNMVLSTGSDAQNAQPLPTAAQSDPKTLGLIYWAGTHGLVNLYMAGKIGEPELRALHRQMTQTLARGARRPSEAKSRRPRAG